MFLLEQSSAGQVNQLDPAYSQFRDHTRFWIQRVAVPLLMVIGVFGNLITVIIMTRRRMRSTTNMYLAALAIVDMFYLILTFLLGLSHYPNMAEYKYYLYWRSQPFLMMLTDACSNTSVWLTVTFTIERYIAVKYPMKGKVWCTEARAKMLITCVFIFGILFAAPVPFEWKVIEKKVHSNGISGEFNSTTGSPMASNPIHLNDSSFATNLNDLRFQSPGSLINDSEIYILALDYTDFGRNETYKTFYYRSTAIIFYFIPLFSLMLFNGFLIKSVHQSQRERTKMTTGHSTSQQLGHSSPKKHGAQPCGGERVGDATCMLGDRDVSTLDLGESLEEVKTLIASENKMDPMGTMEKNKDIDSQLNEAEADLSSYVQISEGKYQLSSRPNGFKMAEAGDAYRNESYLRDDKKMSDPSNSGAGRVKFEHKRSSEDIKLKGYQQTRLIKLKNVPPNQISAQPTSSPASSQERRITIMLIAVVILFLICQIPSAAMLLYTSVHELSPNTNEHALVLAFGNIFNFLMAVNAAGNFILYSFLSKKYRRTFVIIFCNCFKRPANRKLENFQTKLASIRLNTTLNHQSKYNNNTSCYQLTNKSSDIISSKDTTLV